MSKRAINNVMIMTLSLMALIFVCWYFPYKQAKNNCDTAIKIYHVDKSMVYKSNCYVYKNEKWISYSTFLIKNIRNESKGGHDS